MHRRSHLLALIAGMFLAVVAATPGHAERELPRPRAAQGEPEITSQKSVSGKGRFDFQRFTDGGTYGVDEPRGSIAFLYRAFDGRTEDLRAQTVPVVCTINFGGMVLLNSCRGEGDLSDEQRIALNIATIVSRGAQFPQYRALPEGFADLNRTVMLTLAIPAISAPQVDLTTGPLVDPSNVDADFAAITLSNNYPARALRKEIEGNMLIECQIQLDLSVICRLMAFDPPEHAGVFAPTVDTIARRLRAKPLLKDGSDARGVRFPLAIAWRIP